MTTPGASGSDRIRATADAYVSRADRNKNFGTARKLRIASPRVKRAYVRFDLGDMRDIARATLRLRATGPGRGRFRVARAASAWRESTINLPTAPRRRGKDVPVRSTEGGWRSADVTAMVRGRRTVTFVIWARAGHGAIASREVRGRAPRLVVSESGRAPEPLGPPAPALPPIGPADPREVYWGAYAAGARYGLDDAPWDMGSVDAFQKSTGKAPSLIEWGQAWYECSTGCGMRPFRADLMQRVRDRGAIPVLSWGSYAEHLGVDQPDFQLADIIAGRYDAFITSWARDAARWGHPFFLRFDWEMNTNSVPYSEHSNGNRRGEFAVMWRHVHDLFAAAGATNATWVWCPNVEYEGSVRPLGSLYPGDDYVDWTCLDGYNWGTNPSRPAGWTSPQEVFGPSYELLMTSIAPSKPVMIGETAATESGGSKADWIATLFGEALTLDLPNVRAVVWFNKDWEGMDWPIESSAEASRAFAAAVAHHRYAANDFAGLSGGPIRSLPASAP